MKETLRPPRVFWILGVCLLVGTVAGASWVLNHSSAQDGAGADRAREANEPFSALGFADVESGISALHPLKKGRVTHVWFKENDEVSAGDMLLSLENDQARHDVRKAKIAWEAAKNQLAKAKLLVKQHEELVAAKRAAVEVKKHNRDAAEQEHKKAENYYRQGLQGTKFDLAIAEHYFKAAEAAFKAEEHLLKELELKDPELEVKNADLQVQAREVLFEKARLALFEHDVYAPSDGVLLRVLVNAGESIGEQPKPALQFCPNTPRIIRAEVLQEWANRVEKGQTVVIEDDTRSGPQWQGKVKRVSDWFTHRRAILLEPFQFNDVRTLECIIVVDPSSRPLRIGQRVRVTFK